ncbi:hypothetical protein BJ741DRAFT_665134 [Chytriomyces cf. hyalinus JEL632]|nr:hypothetical protein BJ741DRAFT_665134 [Chytriomyces cf. hyalinus JEL632]
MEEMKWGECYAQHQSSVNPARTGLGLFIICGIFVSYLPQFTKIVRLKSSRGISAEFLLIGCAGGGASLSNIVLLQSTVWTPFVCFENTLGLTQIFIQAGCFWIFVFLFIAYFPHHDCMDDESEIVEDTTTQQQQQQLSDAVEITESTTPSGAAYIRALKMINLSILILLAFAFISAVTLYSLSQAWLVFVASVFGVLSALSSLVLFLPQIFETVKLKSAGALSIPTLVMQVPGNFLFALSISLAPGANFTSYAPLLISGVLQFVLLALCLHYNKTTVVQGREEEREALLD